METKERSCCQNQSDAYPLHFTYKYPDSSHLEQGDILQFTNGLKEILDKVHRYYSSHHSYTHFMVITQSCDLFRRSGKCKASCINLVPIQPVKNIILREIKKHQENELQREAHFCRESKQAEIKRFIERLLNNNEKEYFYLHDQPEKGLLASCASIRVSIALRAHKHYETCLKARILALDAQFQAKLGWLVGDLYARVGTDDWDSVGRKDEFKDIQNVYLTTWCNWINDERVSKANKLEKQFISLPPEQIIDEINKLELFDYHKEVVNRIVKLLEDNKVLNAENREKIINLIKNDTLIKQNVKK